jgi:valyl-tRNA synthetase
MVRDKDGRKMSKAVGNVLDPIDVMEGITLEEMQTKLLAGNLDPREVEKAKKLQAEQFPKGIAQCGSDALRFGLLHYTMSGKNVNLDVDRVQGYRRFCNKLWQATRFTLFFALKEGYMPPGPVATAEQLKSYPFAAKWMLSRLEATIAKMTAAMTEYEFSDTVQAVYDLWLYEFCDVYLEICKRYMDPKEGEISAELKAEREGMWHTLWLVLDTGLRLLHPMMPFITEELYHRLPGHAQYHEPSIMIAPWPTAQGYRDEQIEDDMATINKVIHAVRSVKAQMEISPKVLPNVIISCSDARLAAILTSESANISLLGVCGPITIQADEVPRSGFITSMVAPGVTIGVAGEDVNVDAQLKKLDKKRGVIEKSLTTMKKKAEAADYESKVPPEVRAKNVEMIGIWEEEIKQLGTLAETLNNLRKA